MLKLKVQGGKEATKRFEKKNLFLNLSPHPKEIPPGDKKTFSAWMVQSVLPKKKLSEEVATEGVADWTAKLLDMLTLKTWLNQEDYPFVCKVDVLV